MRSISLFIVTASLILIVGCAGTVDYGVDQTATPNYGATATLAAVLNQNSQLATQVARQLTPTPVVLDLGQLAYVQGGDIWVKALPDGKAQRLTTDGRNSQPRWSPSGRWIAFLKDKPVVVEQEVPCDVVLPRIQRCFASVNTLQRQVWLIMADGSGARALAQGNEVVTFAWSPSEDRIAYVTAAGELLVINANDTGLRTLVAKTNQGTSSGTVGRIAWSPDGSSLAFEWKIQQPNQPTTYQGLWQVTADGSGQAELYSSNIPKKRESILEGWPDLKHGVLFWQPDIDSTSLTEGVPLYRLPVNKVTTDTIAAEKVVTDSMLAYTDFVAPAPPKTTWGNRGALAIIVGTGRATWSNKRISLDGNWITPINFAAISPAWSPDGSAIAFAAMPDAPNLTSSDAAAETLLQRHLWVVNTMGEPLPRLLTSTQSRDENPLWSADGSTILFVRLDSNGQSSIWIVRSDGSNAVQVVAELTPSLDPIGFNGHVQWSVLFDWWRGRGR